METAHIELIAALVFLLAGFVKGVTGMGLPTVSLALLSLVTDLPTAMTLLLLPSLITNLWQAVNGPHLRSLLIEHRTFFVTTVVAILAAAMLARNIAPTQLLTLLGVLLVLYAVTSLAGWQLRISGANTRLLDPLIGTVNGCLTGLTGSFVFPSVLYLQSLNYRRDRLIQAMGLLFTISTLALGVALYSLQRLHSYAAVLSVAGVLPALVGMQLGQRVARRLSADMFRRVFLLGLLGIGTYMLLQPAP